MFPSDGAFLLIRDATLLNGDWFVLFHSNIRLLSLYSALIISIAVLIFDLGAECLA